MKKMTKYFFPKNIYLGGGKMPASPPPTLSLTKMFKIGGGGKTSDPPLKKKTLQSRVGFVQHVNVNLLL
jgi:hypothetical protein